MSGLAVAFIAIVSALLAGMSVAVNAVTHPLAPGAPVATHRLLLFCLAFGIYFVGLTAFTALRSS